MLFSEILFSILYTLRSEDRGETTAAKGGWSGKETYMKYILLLVVHHT